MEFIFLYHVERHAQKIIIKFVEQLSWTVDWLADYLYLQGGQYHRPNREGCYTTATPLLVATSLKHLRCLLHALLVQVYRLFGRQGEIFRQMVFYIIEKLIRSDLWQVRLRAAHSFPLIQSKSMARENGKVLLLLTMKRIWTAACLERLKGAATACYKGVPLYSKPLIFELYYVFSINENKNLHIHIYYSKYSVMIIVLC